MVIMIRCRLLPITLLLVMISAQTRPVHAQMDPALQIALGTPDRYHPGRDWRQHLLIKRPQYALVYNNEVHFPDWVAWHLAKQDFGSVTRGQFAPDLMVARAKYSVILPSDYARSGYDRGHNCPSADRSVTDQDNAAVFLMTNISPQAHGLNAGPWHRLESYCRQLARGGKDIFIYCGHGFSSPTHSTIGPSKIAVPDFAWKIVVVVPSGAGDPVKRITPASRVIAVRIPNINTVSRKDWREFRVSVEEIEKATGLVFFDTLPKKTAAALKNRVDYAPPVPLPVVWGSSIPSFD